VWALIYAPSYTSPPPGDDMVIEDVPKVQLTDPDGDGIYTANYGNFYEQGTYRVVVYASDSLGSSARPMEAENVQNVALSISKTGPSTAIPKSLITYTLTVRNNGLLTATHLVISDSVPSGAFYVGGGTEENGIVRWELPELAGYGGTVQVSFVATATATIVNEQYWVSADDGASAVGLVAVTTIVSQGGGDEKVYLPIVIKQ